MNITQFYDEPLAHASYALISKGKMAVIDPARDPQHYYDHAREQDAQIVAIFETHPHADFISSHLEIHEETGAHIYVSQKVGADYPHRGFDEGDEIDLGNVKITALNTPGHSPDSITILVKDNDSGQEAAFTGDTLFVDDIGRPDLREDAGDQQEKREKFAEDMYNSIQNKIRPLPDAMKIYPAHGAGSLCGKNMSDETTSTMAEQRESNWALQDMGKDEFIEELLNDSPFIPKYFSYAVDVNKKGAAHINESTSQVLQLKSWREIPHAALIIDSRDEAEFKKAHLPGSINIMLTPKGKFETWLGSIVGPEEGYYLVAADAGQLKASIQRSAKIGYEPFIRGAAVATEDMPGKGEKVDVDKFADQTENYTIVDVRNKSESKENKIFDQAILIPLHELRERAEEVPTDKPIVVHCAGGFRSAAGSSILMRKLKGVKVMDLSDAVEQFQENK